MKDDDYMITVECNYCGNDIITHKYHEDDDYTEWCCHRKECQKKMFDEINRGSDATNGKIKIETKKTTKA